MDEVITVAKLIAILTQYPADMRVVIDGYEYGVEDVSRGQIVLQRIKLNAYDDMDTYGPHQKTSNFNEGISDADETALLIGRRSN